MVFWGLDFFYPLGRVRWPLFIKVEITSGNLEI